LPGMPWLMARHCPGHWAVSTSSLSRWRARRVHGAPGLRRRQRPPVPVSGTRLALNRKLSSDMTTGRGVENSCVLATVGTGWRHSQSTSLRRGPRGPDCARGRRTPSTGGRQPIGILVRRARHSSRLHDRRLLTATSATSLAHSCDARRLREPDGTRSQEQGENSCEEYDDSDRRSARSLPCRTAAGSAENWRELARDSRMFVKTAGNERKATKRNGRRIPLLAAVRQR
jgi:hypothetical protein